MSLAYQYWLGSFAVLSLTESVDGEAEVDPPGGDVAGGEDAARGGGGGGDQEGHRGKQEAVEDDPEELVPDRAGRKFAHFSENL